jgi:hypothetical protein
MWLSDVEQRLDIINLFSLNKHMEDGVATREDIVA